MSCFSQNTDLELPFKELPPYPEQFTESTVAARMVEALGFRYYWATDGLREEDLSYKSSKDGRSSMEIIVHIFQLTKIIVNTTLGKQNERASTDMAYMELRELTLKDLKTAADILRNDNDLSTMTIKFGKQGIPFWNLINGPIADAMWHCGQIVMNRRSSGNPINPYLNHFMGTTTN